MTKPMLVHKTDNPTDSRKTSKAVNVKGDAPKRGVFFDMTGMKFGKLLILSRDRSPRKSRFAHWLCQCECGTEKVISGHEIRTGSTVSCGCWLRKSMSIRQRTHGETSGGKRSVEFKTWDGIIDRCCNRNSKNYPAYGGRGISICERWKSSFENFLSDMGRRPSGRMSIDRIDVNGNYDPSNCRWADDHQQQRNRRHNNWLTALGKTRTVAEWAEVTGISQSTIKGRISAGWNPADVISRKSSTSEGAVHA